MGKAKKKTRAKISPRGKGVTDRPKLSKLGKRFPKIGKLARRQGEKLETARTRQRLSRIGVQERGLRKKK